MKEKILEILKRVLELEVIDDNCSRETCSKWDSLRHLALAVEIEIEFDIELEPSDIDKINSVADIEALLTSVN